MNNISYEELILHLIRTPKDQLGLDFLKQAKRQFCKKHKLQEIVSNMKLLRTYHKLLEDKKIDASPSIENLLKKRAIRSQSGIVPVQVMTKPFPCPGKCIFCPSEPNMPKSYLKSEPGAMRAWLNKFNPYKQVYNRLLSLKLNGHPTDKIEMIILGGTWDVYPEDYKKEFIKGLYDACNTFSQFFAKVCLPDEETSENSQQFLPTEKKHSKYAFHVENIEEITYPKTLEQSLNINETAENRIIGLTIETRPEYVTDKNCQFRRTLGITRIEMGVQSMFDSVLKANKRGHGIKETRQAMHRMRQYGFKISIHIMPGLYKSSPKKDFQTFQKIFTDPFLKPDEIKFYPTSVIPNTELNDLYEQGKYIPLETEDIQDLIRKVLWEIVPPYTRIKRLIRDIPSTEIVAGSKVTNLSQLTHNAMKQDIDEGRLDPHKMYQRLYYKHKSFADIKYYLAYEASQKKSCSSKKLCTCIIGQEPDLKTVRNFVSLDTRSREMRHRQWIVEGWEFWVKDWNEKLNIVIRRYRSSVGAEYFLSFEDSLGYLYGFARLLLPKVKHARTRWGLGKKTALIRELHVYGKLQSLKQPNHWDKKKVQHTGLGTQLMELAEMISHANDFKKISVIAGIGVRKYYEKLWYVVEGTYMVKSLMDS